MILRLRAKQQPRLNGRSPQLTNQTQTYSAAKYKSVFFIDVKSLPRDCLWKKRKIASDSLCQYFNLCMVTIVKVKKKIQLVMMLCGKFRLGQCRWFGRATIWFFSSKHQKVDHCFDEALLNFVALILIVSYNTFKTSLEKLLPHENAIQIVLKMKKIVINFNFNANELHSMKRS